MLLVTFRGAQFEQEAPRYYLTPSRNLDTISQFAA